MQILLTSVWGLVKNEFQKGKILADIQLEVKTLLASKYRVLYKDYNYEIGRYIELMYKLLNG